MVNTPAPAGWVVQVTIPGRPSAVPTASGRLSGILGPPSFKYFNVAIAEAEKAIEATLKVVGTDPPQETSAVRRLAAGEIAALGLKAGEVKPA